MAAQSLGMAAQSLGMAVKSSETHSVVELRRQANYWRAQHSHAVKREAVWKEKTQQFEQLVRHQAAQITELTQ